MKAFTTLSVLFVLLISSSAFAAKTANGGSVSTTANFSLPVKYVSFTGNVAGNSVVLNWVTENESDINHYEVERSFNGTDFIQVGIVLDGFEDGAQKAYAFKDNSAALNGRSVAYYRFKQIDNAGKFTYGSNVVICLKNTTDAAAMLVSSNPFTTSVTTGFTVAANGTAQMRIADLKGNIMVVKTVNVTKGFNNITVDGLGSLSAGAYTVSASMNGQLIATQKIIK